jgi:hypothetical protein
MTGTVFLCCTDGRRAALQRQPSLNGIDYLEVADLEPGDLDAAEAAVFAALPLAQRPRLLWQRKLTVAFVNPLLPEHVARLTAATIRIEGGERPDTRHISVAVLSSTADSIVLRAGASGDFSTYRLRIVTSDAEWDPPEEFDPVLAVVDFSFKVDCPTEFDCAAPRVCPPAEPPRLDLDYLARDYASFRRLMLDRIAALSPEWRERHAADFGVTLVELVAYVADYLAYRQDAIATEAYLGTARSRVSVRRHAKLVDYPMHDGCNARVWVQVTLADEAPSGGIVLPGPDQVTGTPTRFFTRSSASRTLDPVAGDELLRDEQPEVFEPLLQPGEAPPRLYRAHNELAFYTWGASDCCLPKGATRATLAGRIDTLRPGDVLVLEEIVGPRTGNPGDADPAHRHAVRLTAVSASADPLGGEFLDPPTSDPVEVTSIEWGRADALPFALCITATVTREGDVRDQIVASVARGNIVLADHGRTVFETFAEAVPRAQLARVAGSAGPCRGEDPEPIPARYVPELGATPVTYAAPYAPARSAAAAMRWAVGDVLPAVSLATVPATEVWTVRRDLLSSDARDTGFVVETESDGTARLRFGDGVNGQRPVADTVFRATYRVGNGTRGNVGADAIAHIATTAAGIDHVRNPLPARGGVDPEHVENVRRFAPVAFRTQERAVTADDYARMTERHPQIQQAAATMRWTGSWRTVFVTVDPFERDDSDERFDPDLTAHLERYRMAGHDLRIDTPRYVPLEIEMQVCAKREYFRSDVQRALLEVFSSRMRPDGRRGLFHPDSFTFGQPVYLSRLYAAAYEVDGVESVTVVKFGRQGAVDPKPLAEGRIRFGRLEIARLENNPTVPDRGVFRLRMAGGK